MLIVKIKANAKINLSLAILSKREDGYHLIDTVMQSVGLFDELEIEKSDKIEVFCDKYDIPQEQNIAFRAAKFFFEDYKIEGGARIDIKKNIPAVAGLGGGSADAAAVLMGLNKLYGADIPQEKLRETALRLGADVPFFINGGCMRAEGIGEKLTEVKPLNSGYILLAKAEQKPSTAEMYRIVDSEKPVFCDTNLVINAVESDDLKELSKHIANSFEAVWEDSFVKKALLSLSPLAVSLSGSGPTWFAVFEDADKADRAKIALEKQNIDAWLVTPQSRAIIFE